MYEVDRKQVLISIMLLLEFNCYLMSIGNGFIPQSHSTLHFWEWKPKFMQSSWANVIDENYALSILTVMSNIFEMPPPKHAIHWVRMCFKPFCIWNKLISDFGGVQSKWHHTLSFNICTHTNLTANFNPQRKKKVISIPIQFTHFTPSVLIFFFWWTLFSSFFGVSVDVLSKKLDAWIFGFHCTRNSHFDALKQINSWFLFRNSLKSKSFAYVTRHRSIGIAFKRKEVTFSLRIRVNMVLFRTSSSSMERQLK